MDLKIVDAILPRRDGLWQIAIADGRITNVAANISAPSQQILSAREKLVIPGLVDAHIHLDKALLLDRYPAQTGTFTEAIQTTSQAKQQFSTADVRARAKKIVEQAIAFGTTTMRTHVEVDPTARMTSLEALLSLKREYEWGITLQLAVFAQEGITNQPETENLLRQALSMGGDLIGSAPYTDPDPKENIRLIFNLAEEFNCDVDFHLDFLDDNTPMLLPFVIAETIQRNWQGRVCLGHMTKLAGLTPTELFTIARAIATAGIAIVALPATDLYMMARQDTHNVRRGVAPIHKLAELGVNVGLATNNVQNLFTPFGDGDLLKICTLLAQVLQMGTTASHELCLEMATTQAAQAVGIANYGISPGSVADLVILDASSASAAVGAAPIGRTTIKNGRVVAKSQLTQTFQSL